MGGHPARGACLAVTGLLAATVLTACGGGEESGADDGAAPPPTSTATVLDDRWPLTGLPVEGALPSHPVLVVKVDNTAGAAPQSGLSAADMVVEEMVEGGLTRLAAFYHSEVPGLVGPVRSSRATDIGIVQPADAILVASGGAPRTVRRVEKAGIEVRREGAAGFSRDGSRSAPYNLFVDLAELAETLPVAQPPGPYLTWGTDDDLPEGERARSFSASFSQSHTTRWSYRGGRYVNEGSRAAQGDELQPDTVLVLRVRVGDAGYRDSAGSRVPETKLTGDGEALVFHDGALVRGTWHKDALDAPLELSTDEGELSLPAGRTWVELVPVDGGSVNVR